MTLIPNAVYEFIIMSRNAIGYSAYSNIIQVRCASVPNPPTNVIAYLYGETISVLWTVPYDGGSAITGYNIMILTSNGLTYSKEMTGCIGNDIITILTAQCTF
jgi:hypothetical protein